MSVECTVASFFVKKGQREWDKDKISLSALYEVGFFVSPNEFLSYQRVIEEINWKYTANKRESEEYRKTKKYDNLL